MKVIILASLLFTAALAANSSIQRSFEHRKLLQGGCTILGKAFTACYSTNYGTVGYSLKGSVLSVGVKGGSPSGYVGWTVGQPHRGSSAVFNVQGATSKRTMNGQLASMITSPSKVSFGSVKGGNDGGQLAATFTMKWNGNGPMTVSMASGNNGFDRHMGIPRVYTLTKNLQMV